MAVYVFFVSDGINKFFQVQSGAAGDENIYEASSVSVYVRLLFELLCFMLILSNLRRKTVVALLWMLLFIALVLFGNLVFVVHNDYDYDWIYHIKLLNKYIFAMIIYMAITPLRDSAHLKQPLIAFRNIVFINSLLILLGLFTNLTYFKSYHTAIDRFGFNGLSPSINETTLFYIIGVSFLYQIKNTSKFNKFAFWFVIATTLLLGAKGFYLYLILLFLYVLIYKISWLYKLPIILFFLFCIGFIAYQLFFVYPFLVEKFIQIYNNRGLLSTLLSERDMLFEWRFGENIKLWTFLNYLFGGYDQRVFIIEMDFVDIFLFFGTIGSLIYLYLNFFLLFSFPKKTSFIVFFVLVYFFQAALSGHFFYSATNSLYLVLICLFFSSHQRIDFKSQSKSIMIRQSDDKH